MTNLDLQNYLQASRNQQLLNSPAINPQQYGVFQSQPLQLGMTPEQLQAGLQQANYVPIADAPVAVATEPVAAPEPSPAAAVQEPQKMYPYDIFEAEKKRQKEIIATGFKNAMAHAATLPREEADSLINRVNKYVENTFPDRNKEFKDLPEAENVKTQAPQLHKEINYTSKIYNELKEASKIKDQNEKVARLQAIVPKLIQSAATGSSEAMNQSDALYGAPELENLSSFIMRHNSRGIFNNAALAVDYANLPTNKAALERILNADPDAYIRKAMGVHNSLASAITGVIDNLSEQTSPKFVEKFGIKKPPLFSPSDMQDQYEFALKGANAPIQQAIGQGVQTLSDQELRNKYRTKK